MKEFRTVTVEEFNRIFGTSLDKGMNYIDGCNHIEEQGINYWYMSMSPKDVLEDLNDNDNVFINLNYVASLYYIKDLCIYISTYE